VRFELVFRAHLRSIPPCWNFQYTLRRGANTILIKQDEIAKAIKTGVKSRLIALRGTTAPDMAANLGRNSHAAALAKREQAAPQVYVPGGSTIERRHLHIR
jgi:hypothetical protein